MASRSRAAGSQVRNHRRRRGPSLKVASAALMTPVGGLSTGLTLSPIPLRGIIQPVSPLTPGVAATGSSTPWSLGLDPVSGVHFPGIPASTCRAGPPAFSL